MDEALWEDLPLCVICAFTPVPTVGDSCATCDQEYAVWRVEDRWGDTPQELTGESL